MSSSALLYPFSVGMVAAINPCGFALLPAYLSYYLGLESAVADDTTERSRPVPRAIGVGLAMTLGFVVVFGVIGAAWSTVQQAIGDRLPWVVVGLGVVMIGFGIAMVRGFVPMVKLPKLASTSGSQSIASSFVFGLSYGVASLSCAIAPFIAAVTPSFGERSMLDTFMNFVAYALGMGTIICVLTLAVTFARHGLINRMRSFIPHMSRVSGGLLVVSGFIAIYYGWYEASILSNGNPDSALGRTVTGWRSSLQRWLSETGEERIGLAVAVVVIGALAISWVLRRPSTPAAPIGAERDDATIVLSDDD